MQTSFDAKAIHPLLPRHQEQIDGSAISPTIAHARGDCSVTTKVELAFLGFIYAQDRAHGMHIHKWVIEDKPAGHPYRPAHPRKDQQGKIIKYKRPCKSINGFDVCPSPLHSLDHPNVRLVVTEGIEQGDALASLERAAIALTSGLSGTLHRKYE